MDIIGWERIWVERVGVRVNDIWVRSDIVFLFVVIGGFIYMDDGVYFLFSFLYIF